MSRGMAVGQSIQKILLDHVPGALTAKPATATEDRNGTDWWVEQQSGEKISIDCKVREEDFKAKSGADDLALETWSCIERQIVGWSRNSFKRTDYILWLWKDTGRWCLIPFPMLCHVFSQHWEQWRTAYKTSRQKTLGGGYHSECTFVPRREVWKAIYLAYGGSCVSRQELKLISVARRTPPPPQGPMEQARLEF